MIKIKLHSITDLITNSSTTIFTYSEGSEQALKDMINEIITTLTPFNLENLTCDDMFDIVVMCDESYIYSEYIARMDKDDLPEGITTETDIASLYADVIAGKIPKPSWFHNVEEEEGYNIYRPDSYLYLIPKDEKYIKMGAAIKAFLYSTDHAACQDG